MRALFAGFGGQGVLFAGKVVAYAGLLAGDEVSWLPSYGPEMRGGTANCSVTLASEPIGSPLVLTSDVLVAMNQPSFDKFASQVVPEGLVLIDETLVAPSFEPTASVVAIPATKMAEDGGLGGLSNIVLIGALWELRPFCDRDLIDAAIDKCVSVSRVALVEKNKRAIELGVEAACRRR